jgi:hypothetical protein
MNGHEIRGAVNRVITDAERAAHTAECRARFDLIQLFIGHGVTVTHTVCLGILKEHVLVDIDQRASGEIWLCGYPTGDTMRLLGDSFVPADDISPLSVTHVDRIPIDALEFTGKRVDDFFQLHGGDDADDGLGEFDDGNCPCCGQPGLPLEAKAPF